MTFLVVHAKLLALPQLNMPNNRIIYWGIVVLVITVLLWIGAELTKRIEWALPYAGGVGVAMVVGGFIYELWKSRAAKPGPFKKEAPKD